MTGVQTCALPIYDTPFPRGTAGIPINGLVWMGDAAFMREQIQKKLAEGYSCLKLKIGGIDFATELRLLAEIRAVAGRRSSPCASMPTVPLPRPRPWPSSSSWPASIFTPSSSPFGPGSGS